MARGPAMLAIIALVATESTAQSSPPLPPVRPAASDRLTTVGAAVELGGIAAAAVPLPPARPPEFGPEPPKREPAAAPGPPAPGGPAPGVPAQTPAPAGVAVSPTPAPTWPASQQTIRDAPDNLVPGAFPVDQMDAACTRVLASGKVVGRREASLVGPNGCGIAYPLVLRAIVLKDGGQATFEPAPTLRCDLADVLADWVRDELAPLGQNKGRLTGVVDAAAYVCRGRNNVFGAPMSEHGRGDAIDILGLRFGSTSVMLGQAASHEIWAAIREGACHRFKTVLGPGSDGYHEDNLHLDLENRRNGSHYCHWDHP